MKLQRHSVGVVQWRGCTKFFVFFHQSDTSCQTVCHISAAVVPPVPERLTSSTGCFQRGAPGASYLRLLSPQLRSTNCPTDPAAFRFHPHNKPEVGLNWEPGLAGRLVGCSSRRQRGEGSVQTTGRRSAAWAVGPTARRWRRRQRAGVRVKVSVSGRENREPGDEITSARTALNPGSCSIIEPTCCNKNLIVWLLINLNQ